MPIIFSGSAAQGREAFHVEIHMLNVNGKQHIDNMTSPMVPMALAPVIAGIRSLHDPCEQEMIATLKFLSVESGL